VRLRRTGLSLFEMTRFVLSYRPAQGGEISYGTRNSLCEIRGYEDELLSETESGIFFNSLIFKFLRIFVNCVIIINRGSSSN